MSFKCISFFHQTISLQRTEEVIVCLNLYVVTSNGKINYEKNLLKKFITFYVVHGLSQYFQWHSTFLKRL